MQAQNASFIFAIALVEYSNYIAQAWNLVLKREKRAIAIKK